ncbi:MAG: DUF6340 family protein, partial [Elusimicrobia bacterium]|nr:DUF6340 family protein [Elusimicrobiota bacterium]
GLFRVNSYKKDDTSLNNNKKVKKKETGKNMKMTKEEIGNTASSSRSVSTREVLLKKHQIAKKGYVSGNVRMIDVFTGEIIKSNSGHKSAVIIATTTRQAMLMPSDERILDALTGNLANTFSYSLSPGRVGAVRILHKGKDDITKLGVKYAKRGLWKEAKEQWERAININSRNAYAHNNLGVVNEKEKNSNEAIKNYKKALSLRPDEDVFMRNLSRARSSIDIRR